MSTSSRLTSTVLNRRIKAVAPATDPTGQQTRRRFVRERFLARVFADSDARWIVKGATGLQIRVPASRATQDLDLYTATRADPAAALSDLQVAARRVLDDLRFTVTRKAGKPAFLVEGERVTMQVTVEARLGATVVDSFPIDVSLGLPSVVADTLTPTPILGSGFPVYPLKVYPVPEHIADKICAMYELHGNGRPSTRFRDLVDLQILVDELGPLDEDRVTAALHGEARRRNLTLPTTFRAPAPEWVQGYPKIARTVVLIPPHRHHLEPALAHVQHHLGFAMIGQGRRSE